MNCIVLYVLLTILNVQNNTYTNFRRCSSAQNKNEIVNIGTNTHKMLLH